MWAVVAVVSELPLSSRSSTHRPAPCLDRDRWCYGAAEKLGEWRYFRRQQFQPLRLFLALDFGQGLGGRLADVCAIIP
jgi:hypothetical protein